MVSEIYNDNDIGNVKTKSIPIHVHCFLVCCALNQFDNS